MRLFRPGAGLQHADMILDLDRGQLLRMRSARGATIEVLSGRVWITEDGCAADRFLDAGRCYRVGGEGLVLVGAESLSGRMSAAIAIR